MRFLVLGMALLAAVAASASPRKVAVLELRNPAGLPDQEALYLAGLVRGQALRLPSERYFVMTRENILEQLPPGMSLEKCVGECEVETGRNIGADLVVSGDVVRFGGALRVSLRLHETRGGKLLASGQAGGDTAAALETPVADAAARLFAALGEPAVGFAVSPLPPLPALQAPEAHVPAGVGVPLDDVDVEALERYDAAVKHERGEAPSERKAAVWRTLARDAPRYRDLALQRAETWDAYARQEAAAVEARRQREAARERDWTKLSRLLRLEVVPTEDKRRWATAFLEAYGRDRAANPYVDELEKHAQRVRPTVDEALTRAVGHLVRLRTEDGDVLGVLRGFNGTSAVLSIEGRVQLLLADHIRDVVVIGAAP